VAAKLNYKFVLLAADMLALVVSGFVGLYLRFDGLPPVSSYWTWGRYMLLAVPLFAVIYYFFGLYRRLWQYASVQELIVIASAVTLGMIALFGAMRINPTTTFPRSVLAFAWLLNIAAVGSLRFSVRILADYKKRAGRTTGKPTLIVGAGDAARILLEETKKHPELDCRIMGCLDDDPRKTGLLIAGVPVLGPLTLLERLAREQSIAQIIIAMPSASVSKVKEIVHRSAAVGVKAQIMPGLYAVMTGGVEISPIRDVRIEDLLGRPEVKTDFAKVSASVHSKRVLVTGAGGSIGSELCRQLAQFAPRELLLLGRGENSIYEVHRELRQKYPALSITPIIADVQDTKRVESVFALYSPEIVFHAAAHKHVPLMESNPTEALKNNIFGTKSVAEAALRHKAECFVLVSTDKAVNPTNVMGATKRIAELLVQSLNRAGGTKFMAVRFGNVLGSRGSVVPLFKEQIAQGGPITITHPDMTRYFMTISEAVRLVIEASAMGKGGEVFVLDMGQPVKIADLAKDLITLSGLKPEVDVPIVYTGLRPGEKLYEELWAAGETTSATSHPRIRVAEQSFLPRLHWQDSLVRAETLCQHCSAKEVLGLLQSIDEISLDQVAAAASG